MSSEAIESIIESGWPPKTFIRSITYADKIEGVLNDYIRQSIRRITEAEVEHDRHRRRYVKPGDKIIWHGWQGRPYRSPWSFRKAVIVTEAIPITMFKDGFLFWNDDDTKGNFELWDSPIMDEISRLDGINPPTGVELGKVLWKLNGNYMKQNCLNFTRMQIIRW